MMSEKELVKGLKKSSAKFISRTPGKGIGFGAKSGVLGKYQGVKVGGKKYTRFSQIKTTSAGKKTTRQKLAGGIKLAIL